MYIKYEQKIHTRICPRCGKDFQLKTYELNQKLRRAGFKIYCSRECYRQSKIILPTTFKCLVCGKEIKNDKGYRVRKFCSKTCYAKYQEGKPTNNGYKWTTKQKERHSGLNSRFWKGGITPKNKVLRSSAVFKEWRVSVFSRDNWTCQDCGVRGGVLEPHHIKSFAHFPELRFELTNGLTLCHACHKKTDSYGNKKIT